MSPRQFPRRPRVFAPALALSSALVFPGLSIAQSPTYPSVPAPQPVSPDSLPSLPAAVPAEKPVTVPTPAQAPKQAPPATSTPAPDGTQQPQPTYQNPIDQPINVQPAQPAQPGQMPSVPPAQPVAIAPPAPVAYLPSVPVEGATSEEKPPRDHLGSVYIPDDSFVYPLALRLYSLGYLNTAFISMRPWTRRSLLHALEQSAPAIQADANEQAQQIYAKLSEYLATEDPGPAGTSTSLMTRGAVYGIDTVYTRLMGISGLTLRDSYHLGQTLVNDYGRPYEAGFNNLTGFSTANEWGRFSLYVRGEYQHAPSAAGYNLGLANYLSEIDEIGPFTPPNDPQATIPAGPIAAANPFRLQEAVLSFHLLGHEISGGKSDAWLGPAAGGAMAWSNNAENIYSFRINRIEPLHIPYFSYLFGGLRYDFFVGSLKGHTFPNSPWIHSEMFSLRPTDNFEFSFQRSVIWGGEGHEPVTLHTFFRSFFSTQDTADDPNAKNNANDPGARYSDFSFSWRLPFMRKHVTLYTDSIAHDDVSPISAPRRAAYRPGVYLSQIPGIPKLDFRVEASSTDTSTLRSQGGTFNYFEAIQRQGYTNKGFILGDWVGREAKAGQAWLTYHLSGDEWVQAEYLYKKTPKDFILYGTTQNQFKIDVVKRLRPDIELNAWFQYEHWIAPIYQTTHQNDTVTAVQLTFYPKLRTTGTHLNGK